MAAYKYDSYRDYIAGARFVENLATWLQQFDDSDRTSAYNFIKNKLIFFSAPEILRLVEKFVPEFVQPNIIKKVSQTINQPEYKVWSSNKSIQEYQWESRKTIFMGLSDGARIDSLRRVNAHSISNDQFVIATQIDEIKWESLLTDLRKDLIKIRQVDVENERFSHLYLIDDFTASGTSLLRDPEKDSQFKGKLIKFANSLGQIKSKLQGGSPFDENFEIVVHHYIATEKAKNNIENIYNKASETLSNLGLKKITFSFGMLLSECISFSHETCDSFAAICKKYYDNSLEGNGEHGGQSGITDKMFGYAACGLPVVLEHNTPNNSLPLIWAETIGKENMHRMRPLFRRRERYSDLGE